jgi:hypothetical protein
MRMNIQILGLSAQEFREGKFERYCLSKIEIIKLFNNNVVDHDPYVFAFGPQGSGSLHPYSR